MTREELRTILSTYSGVKSKIRGEEILLKTCLGCGNSRWNLEINSRKGVFNCWACSDFKGTVNQLLQKVGYKGFWSAEKEPEPEQKTARDDELPDFVPASESSRAVAYLEDRGITKRDIAHYDIQFFPYKIDNPWSNRVIFPLRDYISGEVVSYQGRVLDDSEPKYKLAWKFDNYVGYRHISDIHIVTEGIFDGLKINKAGYNASLLLGTGNIDFWRGWAGVIQINPQHKIFIMLDGEAKKEAHKLKQIITQVTPRCWQIDLPEKYDPGDLPPKTIRRIVEKVKNATK